MSDFDAAINQPGLISRNKDVTFFLCVLHPAFHLRTIRGSDKTVSGTSVTVP